MKRLKVRVDIKEPDQLPAKAKYKQYLQERLVLSYYIFDYFDKLSFENRIGAKYFFPIYTNLP